MLLSMKIDIGILATQPVPDIVRQVRLAESLGYAAAWIADTHLVCRELWVTLGACAGATSRIQLGPGVTVPHTRHVSVTASAILTLEELAEDRYPYMAVDECESEETLQRVLEPGHRDWLEQQCDQKFGGGPQRQRAAYVPV